MNTTNPKTISIVIPTLNSGKTLKDCLQSIAMQDYSKDKLEIIIADGGSTDETLSITSLIDTIKLKVVQNSLKTGEAGKAAGLKHAKNDIIAFIDSDNILPDKNWLKRMTEPFKDPEIIATEPIEYSYRRNDGYITRYCALLGMNDPLCLFLGNYDRYCNITGLWTEMPHKAEDKNSYLKIELDKKYLPTIGANGFLIRRAALDKCDIGDYLFDIDVIYELLNTTNSTDSMNSTNSIIRFAKVKTGIVHIFSGDIKTFARKQRRRIKDYLYYNKLGIRKYPWKRASKIRLLKFILSCLTVFPLIIQSLKGYTRRSDKSWFFHPVACWITLLEYSRGRLEDFFVVKGFERKGWSQ